MELKIPTFDRLMNPLLVALTALGGSGSLEEIYDKVVELEALSDDVLSQLHDPENSTNTEVWYRLAWARTYLKKFGLLENSEARCLVADRKGQGSWQGRSADSSAFRPSLG